MNVAWPAVLYPAPLPQYEGLSPPKPAEPQKEAAAPGKASGVTPLENVFYSSSSSTPEISHTVVCVIVNIKHLDIHYCTWHHHIRVLLNVSVAEQEEEVQRQREEERRGRERRGKRR